MADVGEAGEDRDMDTAAPTAAAEGMAGAEEAGCPRLERRWEEEAARSAS